MKKNNLIPMLIIVFIIIVLVSLGCHVKKRKQRTGSYTSVELSDDGFLNCSGKSRKGKLPCQISIDTTILKYKPPE